MMVAMAGRSTPGEAAERAVGRHDGGAGVSSAEHRGGRAVAHGLGRELHGGARLAAERGRRRLPPSHRLGRVEHLDVERARARMARQLALDGVAMPDEQQPDLQVPRRHQRAIDDGPGGIVAPHRVNGYPHGTRPTGSTSASIRAIRAIREIRGAPVVPRGGNPCNP
jgi:hypothetical protein